MLSITIQPSEQWDETNERFIYPKKQTLQLEHSLISISKWEEKWCKPFFSKEDKTIEEWMDYIKCMTLNRNIDSEIYNYINDDHMKKIGEYISSPMTATRFYDDKRRGINGIITSEIIYYDMVMFNIPFECEKWHINRLIALIRVCAIKSKPPRKMGAKTIMNNNTALNAARRKELNTRG